MNGDAAQIFSVEIQTSGFTAVELDCAWLLLFGLAFTYMTVRLVFFPSFDAFALLHYLRSG